MHIFLTGNMNVGKSSVIERILAQCTDKKLSGFRTVCGANSGVFIEPASFDDSYPHTEENRVGIRREKGSSIPFPHVFDGFGCELLSDAEGADIILMDELGILENRAHIFTARVLEILDGQVQVLGVIKPKQSPFLNAVRAHPNMQVFEVTPENREQVFCLLKKKLQGLL